MSRAAVTSRRKFGLSSGAPPVMSSVRCGAVQEVDHQIGGRRVHFLGAVRSGVDVAVHAGLVAAIADVDLQRSAARARSAETKSCRAKAKCRASGIPRRFRSGPETGTALAARHLGTPCAGTNSRELWLSRGLLLARSAWSCRTRGRVGGFPRSTAALQSYVEDSRPLPASYCSIGAKQLARGNRSFGDDPIGESHIRRISAEGNRMKAAG